MWKIISGAVAAIIVVIGGLGLYLSDKIYLRDNHRTVPRAEFDRLYSPDEVQEDIAALTSTIRKIHPDFEGVAGVVFEARCAALAASLDGPMTRVEVYRRLAPLNHYLRDGHTYLRPPLEERLAYEAAGGRYLPMTVRIFQESLIVKRPLIPEANIEARDKITAINGVSASELAAFSLKSQSGESLALRRAYAEKFFYRDLWAAGVESPFAIRIRRDGAELVVTSPGLAKSDYIEKRNAAAPGNAFTILENNIALLTFNDMPLPNREFRQFLKSSFESLNRRSVNTLIIDMRENGGGDSRAGDMLMTYLTDQALPSVKHVDVKVTEEIKRYYKTLLPAGFRWIPLHWGVPMLRNIQNEPPDGTFRFYPGPDTPRPRRRQPEYAFDGQLYVLTGPRTYSSAVIFAAPMKHYGRATFVGEETGEPLIFFGENYYFDLPHTRLQAQVSHKMFTLVGASDAHTGILPDIPTRGDALETALKAISADR